MIEIPTWNEITVFFVDQIKNNDFFAAAGFASILGLLWQYTRKYPQMLWNRIKRKITYTVNIYETDYFYNYFEIWLAANYKKSYRNVEVELKDSYNPSSDEAISTGSNRDKNRSEELRYKQYTDFFYIRIGLKWIKIWKGREKLENANNLKSAFLNRFEVTGICCKRTINNLMAEILKYNIELREKERDIKVRVYTNYYDNWNIMEDISPKILDKMVIDGKEDITNDMENFLGNKKWYTDKSLIHKRGYMFKGAPGNGKTSLAMALARKFEKNIYIFSPTKVEDNTLINLYRGVSSNSFLVIEDIDAIFNSKREKEDDSIKFNFSTLLNCLDGIFSKEGVITIFTTNHPERLDPALIRAGRIDYIIDVSNPNKKRIEEYLNIFFEKDDSFIEYDMKNNNLPMVKVQDICIRNKDDFWAAKTEIERILYKNLNKKELV